jgi:hypothetical protein
MQKSLDFGPESFLSHERHIALVISDVVNISKLIVEYNHSAKYINVALYKNVTIFLLYNTPVLTFRIDYSNNINLYTSDLIKDSAIPA